MVKYGEFTFDSRHGFTGSARSKGYKRGGYAEGGMRSESTEEAKATRRVQDDAFAPAKQLNKSLKNLNRVRKETGYGLDDDTQNYARGGLRKMRSDRGKTKMIETPSTPRSSSMPGQLAPVEPASLQNPTPIESSSPLSSVASSSNAMPGMKKGGKTKYAKGGIKKFTPNEDPNQMLLGDIKPVTQKDLLELEGSKPLRGRGQQKPASDLFKPLNSDEPDLFKRRGGKIKRK
jgi:hypothetical protein